MSSPKLSIGFTSTHAGKMRDAIVSDDWQTPMKPTSTWSCALEDATVVRAALRFNWEGLPNYGSE